MGRWDHLRHCPDANYMDPGMGLATLWTAAVFGLLGGIVLIFQALLQRSA